MYSAVISSFSILERIDVGETSSIQDSPPEVISFSILERIDVGETHRAGDKQLGVMHFQYPRTDRRG